MAAGIIEYCYFKKSYGINTDFKNKNLTIIYNLSILFNNLILFSLIEVFMFIAKKSSWYLERVIWLVAGSIVLIGTILSVMVNKLFIILPILAGINLIIFSLSGFCLMANILVKIGFKPCCNERP